MQLTVTSTATHGFVSDHCMVSIELSLKKPTPPVVRREERGYSKVTPQNFTESYTAPNYSPNTTLDEAYHLFKEKLLKALNQTAPMKTIKCTNRPKHPWHNKFIKEQKRVVNNREKAWRRNKQDHHWQAYAVERNIFNRLFTYQKKTNTVKKIKESNKDTKKLFSLVNNLTGSKSSNPMPEGQTDGILAEEFANFFLEKLRTYKMKSQALTNLNNQPMRKYHWSKNSNPIPAMMYTRKYSV